MHWIALQPEPPSAGDATALVDPCAAWAWRALQFTPLVARVEAALVMEVSASERLFGGVSALLAQMFEPNGALTPVDYAQGATSLIAYGCLQHRGKGLECAGRQTPSAVFADAKAADALPLYTLVAARAHLPTLVRLGLRSWGQLRALPRGGLVRRFGAALVDALDCAYGHRAEVYPWLTLPDVFDAPLELAASVETAPALLFGARRLLAQLQAWLRARQHGVLALELRWELDARRSNALHVDAHHSGGAQGRLVLRTAQPTQDMAHLARLLSEQLARVNLPAPVLTLRLRSLQTQALVLESLSLLPEDLRQGDSLHQLLERLGARLGPEQVRHATLQADHRPEHMQHWQSAVGSGSFGAASGVKFAMKSVASHAHSAEAGAKNVCSNGVPDGALYPTWLLAAPLGLEVLHGLPQYQGPLTLLAGPQRLESGWLGGDAALRDYYVARSPAAGLLWVFRQRLEARAAGSPVRWYLHGWFA